MSLHVPFFMNFSFPRISRFSEFSGSLNFSNILFFLFLLILGISRIFSFPDFFKCPGFLEFPVSRKKLFDLVFLGLRCNSNYLLNLRASSQIRAAMELGRKVITNVQLMFTNVQLLYANVLDV